MHAHLVAARQKTQNLMDEIDSLSSSKYGHPDYMMNFGNRVTKIQQAIQVRYVDGLLTRYRGRLLYMPPRSITQLRADMYDTGLFGTHNTIKNTIVVQGECQGDQSAGYFYDYKFSHVNKFIEFCGITLDELNTFQSMMELSGKLKYNNMFSQPIIIGEDFESEHDIIDWDIRRFTDVHYMSLSKYEHDTSEIISFVDVVLSHGADTIKVDDYSYLTKLLSRMRSMTKVDFGSYNYDNIVHVMSLHKRAIAFEQLLTVIEEKLGL